MFKVNNGNTKTKSEICSKFCCSVVNVVLLSLFLNLKGFMHCCTASIVYFEQRNTGWGYNFNLASKYLLKVKESEQRHEMLMFLMLMLAIFTKWGVFWKIRSTFRVFDKLLLQLNLLLRKFQVKLCRKICLWPKFYQKLTHL